MKKNKRLKKRRGFVMATVFVAMSVVMLLSSVLLLMVQVDMNRSKLNDTLLKREETLQKIADEFKKGDLSGNEQYSDSGFYCRVVKDSSASTETLYVSGSAIDEKTPEKDIDYILKITIDDSENITLWDRKK